MRKSMGWMMCAAVLLSAVPMTVAGTDDEEILWFDRIEFSGDLRFRYEHFDWEGMFDNDTRDRFRYRFRLGATTEISDDVKVGFQLRSGNPDNPHSDNQSFDTGFDKNTISIAEAYVAWKPRDFVEIRGGKFSPKKIWMVSDLQWDDDVVVEGAMEDFTFGGGDGVLKAFEVSAYQLILEESSSQGESYLFGAQFRPVLRLDEKNQLTVGAGYDSYTRPDGVVAQTFGGNLDTEPDGIVTNLIDPATGQLVSDFRILTAFAEWKNKSSKKWPVKVSLFYYQNLGAENLTGAILDDQSNVIVGGLNGKDNDSGSFARIQVGDYKKPGQVAFRLSRYDAEPDSMFYAWVQSDTRRGTNVDGDRLDIRIGMPKSSHVNLTWYHTDWKLGQGTTMDRLQLDYVFAF